MSERAHRRYSPSQAPRFFACRGCVKMCARVPARPTSKYAIEGTKAHDVLDAALKNGVRDAETAHLIYSEYCDEELNVGNNEFYLSIQMALDHVYGILDAYPDAQIYTERFVNPPIQSLPGEAGGYLDIAIYVPSAKTLFVKDYKHGGGVTVEGASLKQLMQYAAGLLYEDDACIDVSEVHEVVLTVIQPRAFHERGPIREDIVTPFEVWEYLEELDEVIAECEQEDAPLTPGESQCRFCDAKTSCPAREEQALAEAKAVLGPITTAFYFEAPDAKDLDLERLGRIRLHAPEIRKFLKDVEDHCFELAMAGHKVPGAKLVQPKSSREYYGTEKEVAAKLAAMLADRDGVKAMEEYEALKAKYPILDKMFQFKLVPMTTAEKLVVSAYRARVGRGKKDDAAHEARQAFAYLTTKSAPKSYKLVDQSDPAPEVKRTDVFAKVANAMQPLLTEN